MARSGSLAAVAVVLMLAPSSLAGAVVLECPSEGVSVGKGVAGGSSPSSLSEARDKAVDRARDQMDAWHEVHDGELSCRPAPEPCSLVVFDRERVGASGDPARGWSASAAWTMFAACRRQPRESRLRGGVSHLAAPAAGGSTSAGGGGASAGPATTPGAPKAPLPLVDCVTCEQLQPELKADEAKLAAAEADERMLTGKVKSAQVLGAPTGALEAQLASNASDQAGLRALIKVVENKLKLCPPTCQQPPANPWQPR